MKPKNKSITAVAIFIILVLISAAATRSVTSVYHAKPFWQKDQSREMYGIWIQPREVPKFLEMIGPPIRGIEYKWRT